MMPIEPEDRCRANTGTTSIVATKGPARLDRNRISPGLFPLEYAPRGVNVRHSPDSRPVRTGGGHRAGRIRLVDRRADPEADLQQARQVLEPDGVRAVGEGLLGLRVDLQEEGVAAGGDRRTGEVRDHRPLAPGDG